MHTLNIYFIKNYKNKKKIIDCLNSLKSDNFLIQYFFNQPKNIKTFDPHIPSFYIYNNDNLICYSSKLNHLRKKISYAKCFLLFKNKKFIYNKK